MKVTCPTLTRVVLGWLLETRVFLSPKGSILQNNSHHLDRTLTEQTCVASEELRQWCRRNKDRCYIPEWLLKQWGIAFGQLSMTIGPRFGQYRDGFRFGHLGVALVEREDLARFRGKVYNIVSYHVLPWTQPIRAASSMLQRALDLTQRRTCPAQP